MTVSVYLGESNTGKRKYISDLYTYLGIVRRAGERERSVEVEIDRVRYRDVCLVKTYEFFFY